MSAAATSLLAHAATAPRGGVSASSFIAGRPHRHTDGTVVWFGDDTWIIAPRQSGRGQKSLTFIDLPEWLRLPAKWCLATAWLEEGLSVPWLLDAMRAFRLLARVLTGFQGPGLDQLTPDDARRKVSDYLDAGATSPVLVPLCEDVRFMIDVFTDPFLV